MNHFPIASAQPSCPTARYIENVNEGRLRRIADIKGKSAILFIALDPIWSEPEFKYKGYRDKHFIQAMKQTRETLLSAGIDEIIVWQLPRRRLGAAVPFKDGCAVSGYGEPDFLKKLKLMYEAYLLISKHGLNDPSVRPSINKNLMAGRYAGSYNNKMIDIIIDNLRSLIKATKVSHNDEQ